MGIDAKMFVKLNYKISEEELIKKSYIFGSMFKHCLFLGHKEEVYHKPLEIICEINGDGYGPDFEFRDDENTTLINIPLGGRYYGEGYERGPIMQYIIMAQFLEMLFPEQEVYYGGDSSGVPFVLFDKDSRRELMEYAIKVGHEPYRKGFSGNHTKHICPNCKVGMVQNGHKGKLGFYTCAGCGWNVNEISETEIKSGFELKFL